jgi:intein/homing endonuclease
MIISKRIITELEYQYRKTFSDELKKYLLLKYSEEPFPYVFSEQDLYTNIRIDIRSYEAGKLDVTIKSPSKRWKEEREYYQALYIDKCHEASKLEEYIEELERMLLTLNIKPFRLLGQEDIFFEFPHF